MALLSKNNPPKPVSPEDRIAALEDRIVSLRAELDSEIDRRAAELKQGMPGVPLLVVRNIISRNNPCQCAAYLHIKDSDV